MRPPGAAGGVVTIRSQHEDRDRGEVRPVTVEQAVRAAQEILSGAGASLSPSKVARLCRDFLRVDPPSTFRAFLIRNAGPAVSSLPRPSNRHGLEWVDNTGNTAVNNVMQAGGVR